MINSENTQISQESLPSQNSKNLVIRGQSIIDSVKYSNTNQNKNLTVEQRRELAIELAAIILKEARRIQTTKELRTQSQIAGMMNDPKGKIFTLNLTDECFRSHRPARVANQMIHLLNKYGVPQFLSYFKKLELSVFKYLGNIIPALMVPLAQRMLRKETATVIIPGERRAMIRHMKKRRSEGVRINLNHLGEAILGESEAERRLKIYLEDLSRPEVEYISVKISTIYSQINLLAWEDTLQILETRLKELYRQAKKHTYKRPNGKIVPKFVNLDMEEYRDLNLTVELFRRVLDDPEFFQFLAGIVLQGYLPDSHLIQQELTVWAMQRVANGGAPIKIRLVKGANLAMEKVDAALNGWNPAPYASKAEVDANYKRMVHYGCQPGHAEAARIGIGSHNLFDIAYAMLLRAEMGVENFVEFEMLEGMADHTRRVIQQLAQGMLLYCPAAKADEFQSAVAYLVRRLDENTDPANFLHDLFTIYPGNREWHNQVSYFSLACHTADSASLSPRRAQNRLMSPKMGSINSPFENEPNTDWSLTPNRKWIQGAMEGWKALVVDPIPVVIGGVEYFPPMVDCPEFELNKLKMTSNYGIGKDPSRPEIKELYRYAMADSSLAEKALETAERAQIDWGKVSIKERNEILASIAYQLRLKRADLIGAMLMDGGKTVQEADVEVSEAIDFAEYYRHSLVELCACVNPVGVKNSAMILNPRGPVLVTPPWNFPCAIPLGGIVAALAAGNCVIFKPARVTAYVGWVLAQACWEAGVSRHVLQFILCEGDSVGSQLVKDPRIAAVILTGGTNTAKKMYKLRPGLHLIAETGGKDAMIITGMADRDLAIKDLVQSAFGHSGQKCSACSLAILEAEVYDDPQFRKALRDAAASLRVGSAWDFAARVTPLVNEAKGDLKRALTTLENGQEWLLEPKQDEKNPNLWSPGIKLGVKKGSYDHTTEFFGPVLGVMRADNLDHAIRLANGTRYGLTSGIHSLDERERKQWIEQIEAGNLYVNRGITGAIVRRQPFGGCKESGFGPGAKAGGPNYLVQLMKPVEKRVDGFELAQNGFELAQNSVESELSVDGFELAQNGFKLAQNGAENELLRLSIKSYQYYWNNYFSLDHDPSQVLGEDNIFRYIPRKDVVLRVSSGDRVLDVKRVIAAAIITGAYLCVSVPIGEIDLVNLIDFDDLLKRIDQQEPNTNLSNQNTSLKKKVEIKQESELEFIRRVNSGSVKRVRMLTSANESLLKAFADAATVYEHAPVLMNGRIELLHYLREVSISYAYHRYGNLGEREQR